MSVQILQAGIRGPWGLTGKIKRRKPSCWSDTCERREGRGKIKLQEPQITEWLSESVDKAEEDSLSLSHTVEEPHVVQEWAGGINPLWSDMDWDPLGRGIAWAQMPRQMQRSDREGPRFPCWLQQETRVAHLHGFHSGDAKSDSVTCGEMVCVCIM